MPPQPHRQDLNSSAPEQDSSRSTALLTLHKVLKEHVLISGRARGDQCSSELGRMAEMTAGHGDSARIGGLLRGIRRHAKRFLGAGVPDVGAVRWADLRRTSPIGEGFGYHRGTPIDRYYIERFLAERSADIAGRVLEVQSANYTRRFGAERVSRSDVLDIDETNPNATIVADLNDAKALPTGAFDCIILTQTLQLIYEVRSALRALERSLAPGGVLLVTVPGITRIPQRFSDDWYWSFTCQSMRRLLEELFAPDAIEIVSMGNVKATTGFLHGLALEELRTQDLDRNDPEFQLVITARARKA
jgi:SAM-dependent methyltransferase